jgi:transposase-like protein
MSELPVPTKIVRRRCPRCKENEHWSTFGFSYGGGDDSRWQCYLCRHQGKPEYTTFKMRLEELR